MSTSIAPLAPSPIKFKTKILKKFQVFTKEWHKIHFGVFRDRVTLFVNCQPVGEKPMEIVDSRIDLNGEIIISKEAESRRTTPLDLQWMVMACDPEGAERETCDELPVIVNRWRCLSIELN